MEYNFLLSNNNTLNFYVTCSPRGPEHQKNVLLHFVSWDSRDQGHVHIQEREARRRHRHAGSFPGPPDLRDPQFSAEPVSLNSLKKSLMGLAQALPPERLRQ